MRIDILSLFPDMFQATLGESIIGKAQDNGFLDINVTDFRKYTTDKHNHVDDAPFGGGAGCYYKHSRFLTQWMPSIKKQRINILRDG